MKDTWERLIARTELLVSERPESKELLAFYATLLRSQKQISEYLRSVAAAGSQSGRVLSGALELDLPVLRVMIPTFLIAVESSGPDALASHARDLLEASDSDHDQLLIEYWRAPSDLNFFAKAFLQPYARLLAETGVKPGDRNLGGGEDRCPFCEGKPQVSVLQIKEASSESGGRDLLCATCLTRWPFRRVACASCGEENPAKIGYYDSPDFAHVRVDACDSCKHYIKAVDLTRNGLAVPLVDEVASAPLDLWAREQGYTKIEMNLLGI